MNLPCESPLFVTRGSSMEIVLSERKYLRSVIDNQLLIEWVWVLEIERWGAGERGCVEWGEDAVKQRLSRSVPRMLACDFPRALL